MFAVLLADTGVPKNPWLPGTAAWSPELSGVCSG